jgi:hypothetical protein
VSTGSDRHPFSSVRFRRSFVLKPKLSDAGHRQGNECRAPVWPYTPIFVSPSSSCKPLLLASLIVHISSRPASSIKQGYTSGSVERMTCCRIDGAMPGRTDSSEGLCAVAMVRYEACSEWLSYWNVVASLGAGSTVGQHRFRAIAADFLGWMTFVRSDIFRDMALLLLESDRKSTTCTWTSPDSSSLYILNALVSDKPLVHPSCSSTSQQFGQAAAPVRQLVDCNIVVGSFRPRRGNTSNNCPSTGLTVQWAILLFRFPRRMPQRWRLR